MTKTINKNPKGIIAITPVVEKEVWAEINCITCGNCCKKMTPTFTGLDIRRIAKHFNESPESFIEKWLKRSDGDYVNVNQPCQFLDRKTNLCTIYEIRPVDCAGFPHLSKKPFATFAHIHNQNINYCRATYTFAENLKARLQEPLALKP